ncbi:hypothetical protein [Desulfosporosinus orientis]|uniref:hypothetical protein n=1 Tax=Desulfosporosinus orientis TaxID=1563 RepID=UPI0005A81BFD|nr:hypothetical protein [Desulfosporosinus orientis]
MDLRGRSEKAYALVAADAKPALKGKGCDGTLQKRMQSICASIKVVPQINVCPYFGIGVLFLATFVLFIDCREWSVQRNSPANDPI